MVKRGHPEGGSDWLKYTLSRSVDEHRRDIARPDQRGFKKLQGTLLYVPAIRLPAPRESVFAIHANTIRAH